MTSHSKANLGGSSKHVTSRSRSKIFENSKLSNSSRILGQSTAGGYTHQDAQIYLDGLNVTPQSLLTFKIRTIEKKEKSNKLNESKTISKDTIETSTSSIISSDSSNRASSFSRSKTENKSKRDTGEDYAFGASQTVKASVTSDQDSPRGLSNNQSITKIPPTITIKLEETATKMLFELQSICVAQESPEHPIITDRNRVYNEICATKSGSDCFLQQSSQTLNHTAKNKEVMAVPPATRDVGCEATRWDIYDCQSNLGFNLGPEVEEGSLESSKTKPPEARRANESNFTNRINEIVSASLASPGCLLDVDGDIKEALAKGISAIRVNKMTQGSGKGGKKAVKKSKRDLGASSVNVSSYNASGSIANIGVSMEGGLSSSDEGNSSRNIINSHASSDGVEKEKPVDSTAANVDINEIIAEKKAKTILLSNSLYKNLCVVEKAVQQNIYHSKHLMYRDFPSASNSLASTYNTTINKDVLFHADKLESSDTSQDKDADSSAEVEKSLDQLWTFCCSLGEGKTVTSMAWNPVNSDLLAVSYGDFNFTGQRQSGGLVLFWSLKNPEFPERIYEMPPGQGVTTIDFSSIHPNLLAVGFSSGIVAIYDTRKQENSPILSSSQIAGTHMDAVWQVKWINRGNEHGESLVSISSDGRVKEWSMKKGLSFTDLMVLKRIHNKNSVSAAEDDGVISRQASGQCIDFAANDSSVYFAGTEDGLIHKCSCSYNEQFLETYFGHSGPVYSIRISPFWPQVFLSCSADWTIKLWSQNHQSELINFHSVDLSHAVHDICWSMNNSTVFGSVTEDGRIELWDLSKSTLDPIVTHFEDQNTSHESTCILFSPTDPVLVVGNNKGMVNVYRLPPQLTNVESEWNREIQIHRLQSIISSGSTSTNINESSSRSDANN